MSIYKQYRLEPSIPHQCMHHRYKTGDRCRGRAMHNEVMCFQHRIEDLPTVLQNDPFELTSLYDRASIQYVVTQVAARMACNHIDLKRAALLLQSCQIAASNLTAHDRAAANAANAPKTAAPPLAPPTQELDPNPDPAALVRYQAHQAELGLDEDDEELDDESPTEPGAPHLASEMWDQSTNPVLPSTPPTAESRSLTTDSENPEPQPATDNEERSTNNVLPTLNAVAHTRLDPPQTSKLILQSSSQPEATATANAGILRCAQNDKRERMTQVCRVRKRAGSCMLYRASSAHGLGGEIKQTIRDAQFNRRG